ncbi:hypothetical protein [Tenacibaculum phage Larrie]|nr:hypothetical protein [Tenacibaculum phage Larrie]
MENLTNLQKLDALVAWKKIYITRSLKEEKGLCYAIYVGCNENKLNNEQEAFLRGILDKKAKNINNFYTEEGDTSKERLFFFPVNDTKSRNRFINKEIKKLNVDRSTLQTSYLECLVKYKALSLDLGLCGVAEDLQKSNFIRKVDLLLIKNNIYSKMISQGYCFDPSGNKIKELGWYLWNREDKASRLIWLNRMVEKNDCHYTISPEDKIKALLALKSSYLESFENEHERRGLCKEIGDPALHDKISYIQYNFLRHSVEKTFEKFEKENSQFYDYFGGKTKERKFLWTVNDKESRLNWINERIFDNYWGEKININSILKECEEKL